MTSDPWIPGDWLALARAVGLPTTSAASIGAELVARHAEAHRTYHTLVHVRQVLFDVDRLLRAGAVAPDPDAVRLAAWFHDAVYDPRAAGNEEASAGLAESLLGGPDVPAQRRSAVARLVRATAGHAPGEVDEAVLCDADLAVLATDPRAYRAYARAIRREYRHLDDATWARGRGAFLERMLGRGRLFHTEAMRAAEARARANLGAERAALQR
ncbi:hypothetical protein BH23ACT8_BH23ACT8_18620 [soil metagenome]